MKIRSATFVLGATSLAGMPVDRRPEIAFVGRSNVGKSSLLNMLLNRKNLARTSSAPGKTREVNFFLINDAFYFVDLPGFGYARASKSSRAAWQKLIGAYVTRRPELRLVCQLIDARHPPTALDREAFLLLMESEAAHMILLTKADKLSGNEKRVATKSVREALADIHLDVPVVLTSASSGLGKSEIFGWIQTLVR